ncbi:MAG: TonB-dependent receptor [Hydrogenophilales bacterium]|nr:TonB-dependent receptor [Hydrogenophilales bacterium]
MAQRQYNQILRSATFAAVACIAGNAGAASSHDALRSLPLDRFIEATSLEQLADIVVTDTKVAQASSSVTQKIVVLHEEDIRRQPESSRNLAELMRGTSGQFVNVLSRNDANWGSYAGLGPKYNSYLLDGLPIDSFVDAMSLDSAAFERIEMHKGPASVLYSNYLSMDFLGNETALAGTTNFVLKSRIDRPLTRLSAGVGSWDSQVGRVYTQGRAGGLSYFAGASAEHSDYTRYGAPGSWLETIGSPEYDKARVYGNLHYELGRADHSLALFLHHTDHAGTHGRPNRDFDHRYDTLNFSYNNHVAENWHIQFKAGERRYERGFANDDWPLDLTLTRYETTRQNIRPLDLTVSFQHGAGNLLTFGIDRQTVDYRTDSRDAFGASHADNDAQADSTGLFVQEKLQWRDWVFRAGLRRNSLEHDYALLGGSVPDTRSASWDKNLWSVGARYNVSPTLAAYANAGSSFMAPAAKQIGGTVPIPSASGELANPTLQPESGLGRDLGFDWQATDRLALGARLFLNSIDDAIVSNVVSAAPSQSRSENAGKASARGIEMDVRYTPGDTFAWFANLTLTDTRVRHASNPDQDGTDIPFAPESVANLGLSANLGDRTRLSAYYHRVGRYYDSTSRATRLAYGDHGVLNLRIQHAIRDNLELIVDLNNLTDCRYDMPFEFRDPGFNAYAGLNLTL